MNNFPSNEKNYLETFIKKLKILFLWKTKRELYETNGEKKLSRVEMFLTGKDNNTER